MSAISLKSITGITSITTPAGVDNQLTLHNNNTTEAVKLDIAGNLHFHNHLNITGISTAANFKTGTSNLHSTGLNIFDLDVDGHTNLDNVSVAGVTTIATNTTIGGNLTVNGTNTILNTTTYVKGGEGAAGILAIYADEGDNVADMWRLKSDTDGTFKLDNYAGGAWETNIKAVGNGAVELYHNGTKKFETSSAGGQLFGHLQLEGNLDMNDGHQILLGTGDDLKIFHNGSTSYITDNGTGDLIINSVDGNLQLRVNDTESAIKCLENGAVELYHDNTKMAYTSSSGFDVTNGDLRSHLNIKVLNDNQKLLLGAGNDLQLYHDGSHSYIDNNTGSLRFRDAGGAEKFRISGSGTQFNDDITLSNDNDKINIGASSDLQIYHSGDWNYIQSHNSKNFVIQVKDNENAFVAIPDGQVQLYHNNNLKMWTDTTGITVQNRITASGDSNTYMNIGPNDIIDLYTGGTNLIRMNANGDLLVHGTSLNNSSVAGQALQINGTTRPTLILRGNSSGGNTCEIQFADNSGTDSDGGTRAGLIKYEHAGTYANHMHFHTNDTEYMVINHQGRVGISQSPAEVAGFAEQLQVGGIYGNNYAAAFKIKQSSGSLMRFATYSGGYQLCGGITVNGTSTSFNTSSDYRLKENDVKISDGITRLKKLRPIRFNWKADPSTTEDGFFAHEVSPVVPESVNGEKDATIDEIGEGYQKIDHSKLVPLLTSALQEAITEIETLKTKVAALEGS